MPKGVYAAASAMYVESQALESVARNLANVRTPGYRQEIDLRQGFAEVLRDQGLTAANQDTIQRERGAGVVEHRRHHVFTQGEQDPTGNPFDFALTGKGFFKVRTPDGQDLLTRAGHFTATVDGRLISPEGFELQGQGGPILIPAEAQQITVARDGTVSAESTLNGVTTMATIDQVRLVEVERPADMRALSGQYFDPGEQTQSDTPATLLRQGSLERANGESVTMLVEMIALQRRHDAAQRSMTEQANLGGQLGEILRS